MAKIAVEVAQLGKSYRIGGLIDPDQTFRESVSDTLMWPVRATRKIRRGQHQCEDELLDGRSLLRRQRLPRPPIVWSDDCG